MNVKVEKQIAGIVKYFEKIVICVLLALMMITVVISTAELTVLLWNELRRAPFKLLDIEKMLDVFGFFLMTLIGLELLESVKSYLDDDSMHVEVVFLAAMVAVARKIIILDYKEFDADMLWGMSAIIVSLSLGFYLVQNALRKKREAVLLEKKLACEGKDIES
ncbi:MAG: phosphate-starvation-inducible PsiE family protein [Desulfobacterales bacterium]